MRHERRIVAGEFLRRRSDLSRSRRRLPTLRKLLIVTSSVAQAAVLEAMLHVLLGYDVEIATARTLGAALDHLLAAPPDHVLLSTALPPSDTAVTVIPILRRCGYRGPIVLVGDVAEGSERRAFEGIGAADLIGADELYTTRLAAALVRASPAAVSEAAE